jgi:hypothetical protein
MHELDPRRELFQGEQEQTMRARLQSMHPLREPLSHRPRDPNLPRVSLRDFVARREGPTGSVRGEHMFIPMSNRKRGSYPLPLRVTKTWNLQIVLRVCWKCCSQLKLAASHGPFTVTVMELVHGC